MKKMLLYCTSSILLQNIYCASNEKKVLSFPSEISAHVDYKYKNYLGCVFENLEPQQQNQKFFSRDASQAYIAFLNDGPNSIISRYPELAQDADVLQQEILADKKSPMALLMNDLESERDLVFWENASTCLRTALKTKVPGIAICSTDLETLEQNDVTGKYAVGHGIEEEQPKLMSALIVMIRFMELNYQQNPDAFETLLRNLSK